MSEANFDGQVLCVDAFETAMANTLCIILVTSPGNLLCKQAHEIYWLINPSPAEGQPKAMILITQFYLSHQSILKDDNRARK